jgi:hypothetical protein
MSGRAAGRVAWGLGAAGLVAAVVGELLGASGAGALAAEDGVIVVLLIVFAAVGSLIVSRQPANPVGWIYCAAGLSIGLGWVADGLLERAVSRGPGSLYEPMAAYAQVSWIPFILVPAMFVPLLFPDGRLLSRRWRPLAWVAASAVVVMALSLVLAPGTLEDFKTIENPYAMAGPVPGVLAALAGGLLLVGLVGAPLSLVLRFRSAGHEQRQQIKWLAWAGALAALVLLPTLTGVYERVGKEVMVVVHGLAIVSLPLAVGLAILRHRLYDVDLVINRTLVYGGLTATLAAAYLGVVLLLQLALSSLTASSNLAIAGSTLAVAALFQPARRRIQAIVDRRFYRRKYDAAQTIERFGTRLRDEVALDTLSDELRAVVTDTMQPAHLSLWLRAPR